MACTMPSATPPSQSSQLSSGRLCRSGCRCRSMAFGVAIKKAKFWKSLDISYEKSRRKKQEREATMMTHRLMKFMAPNDYDDVECVCQEHAFKIVCRTDCSHPRQCVGRWICSRSVKAQQSLHSLLKLHKERRTDILTSWPAGAEAAGCQPDCGPSHSPVPLASPLLASRADLSSMSLAVRVGDAITCVELV